MSVKEGKIDLEDEGVCNLTENANPIDFGEPLSAPEARKRSRGKVKARGLATLNWRA